jgi:hypothetical protein
MLAASRPWVFSLVESLREAEPAADKPRRR